MFKKSSGKTSVVLIVLAVVALLAIVVAFLITRIYSSKTQTVQNTSQVTEVPKPVYETTIVDIRYILEYSANLGSTLPAYLSKYPSYGDLTSTEKFIKVVVSAQNKGKNDIPLYSWDLGNIVDSEGRNFIPITQKAYYFLPQPDTCGALLNPEFEPIPCTRIYEVSSESKGLKIEVIYNYSKKQKELLDLRLN